MKKDGIQCGKYQHYKTENLYEVIGVARHSETLEEMVIYRALYRDEFGSHQVWVRPKDMFFENVVYNECVVPRFKWIAE